MIIRNMVLTRKQIIGGLVILAIIVIAIVSHQSQRFFTDDVADPGQTKTIIIESGTSLSAAAHLMAEEDLVNAFWFRVYAKLAGAETIQPGTYEVPVGESYASILGRLHYGKETEVSVTIPEGFTLEQMGERFASVLPAVTIEAWREGAGASSPANEHPFVVAAGKPDNVDLEGYLFPDTYRFHIDSTVAEIVQKMIDTMQARYEAVATFDPADSFMLTAHEYLTLASIIEREVRSVEDMKLVADIFIKRLKIGMPLQADSTVNYVTGGTDPSISLTDRDLDSPYNTYQNPGLPPGPISNPGLNALAAVFNSTSNSYYYFLTTDDGAVIYATTNAEHAANKAKYLK